MSEAHAPCVWSSCISISGEHWCSDLIYWSIWNRDDLICFITRTINDQLIVDGAKLNGDLKPKVPYKSMGSKCGSSNNLSPKLRTSHSACSAWREVNDRRGDLPLTQVVSYCSSSICSLYFCMDFRFQVTGELNWSFFIQVMKCAYRLSVQNFCISSPLHCKWLNYTLFD